MGTREVQSIYILILLYVYTTPAGLFRPLHTRSTNKQTKGKQMIKHVTTIKLEHNVDESQYPSLSMMSEEEISMALDSMAKGFIAEFLVQANDGATHSYLNLVKE